MDDSFGMGYALGSDANNNNGNNGGFGGDNGWWVLIILFALFGGWGNNGLGVNGNGAQGALTRADLCQDMNFGQLENGVRGISQGICDATFSLNNTITNGFSNNARDLCQGLNAVSSGILENRFANQQCCCTLESAITNAQFASQTGMNALSNQISQCLKKMLYKAMSIFCINNAVGTCMA